MTTNLGHMGWADLEPKQSIDLISKFDRKQNRSCNNCVLSYHWIFCIMNRCGTDKKPHKLTSVCQSSWNFGGLCLAWLGSCLTPFGVDQIIESDSITVSSKYNASSYLDLCIFISRQKCFSKYLLTVEFLLRSSQIIK